MSLNEEVLTFRRVASPLSTKVKVKVKQSSPYNRPRRPIEGVEV